MNVLLTNGDGYAANGLRAMRQALIDAGCNVLTVAPMRPHRRASRMASGQRPVAMDRVGGDDRHPIFQADGSPVDCVRIAILSGMAREVSVVVSGIGEGASIGDDATYSSTTGAAMEAALLGYPAMAVSQQARDGRFRFDDLTDHDLAWCGVVGAELASWMGAAPPPDRAFLNVNAPASLADRHLKRTTLDHRIWDPADCHTIETPAGEGWLTFSTPADRDPRFEMRHGSDAWAIAHGHVSVTPIGLDFGQPRQAARLRAWADRAIAAIDPRLGASTGACAAGCCG